MPQNNTADKDAKKEEPKSSIKPDPETLHKTDPQEHMKGPISSLVHKAEKSAGKNDENSEKK